MSYLRVFEKNDSLKMWRKKYIYVFAQHARV